jgi:hypothetical protein
MGYVSMVPRARGSTYSYSLLGIPSLTGLCSLKDPSHRPSEDCLSTTECYPLICIAPRTRCHNLSPSERRP